MTPEQIAQLRAAAAQSDGHQSKGTSCREGDCPQCAFERLLGIHAEALIDAAELVTAAEHLTDEMLVPFEKMPYVITVLKSESANLAVKLADADACIANREAAAEHWSARCERLEEELRTMISYLSHQDQDADRAWMVKHMRAVLTPPAEPSDGEGQ